MGIYWFPVILIIISLISYLFSRKLIFFRKLLILVSMVANVAYLVWRSIETVPVVNLLSLILGVLLLITEWIGFLQSLVFYSLMWKPNKRKQLSIEFMDNLPTVDIFIATYNEPVSVLKKVVAGSKNIRYPKELVNIYICDDGKRSEVRKLADDFGVIHLTRDDNKHAKAGNLNSALKLTNGEIVVTLDADMVPKPDFLEKTIGYFSDKRVGFVQAPQAFYNSDPFQYNLFSESKIPNEQDFFMRTLQSGKDRFNAVMYVGSNALFTRKALNDIGGFATGVITEDMATGMLLQSKKYKTVFVNEVIAKGLAPESWDDLLKQRDRWCRGNIQCARKWNPLTWPGLNLIQRVLYFDGIVYWFFGVYKVIYTIAPLSFLLFGIYSLQASPIEMLTFWLPSFIAMNLTFRSVSNKQRNVLWSHIYEASMAPYLALSALSELFLKKKLNFKVTPKGISTSERKFLWKATVPHIILLILTITALIKACIMIYHNNHDIGIVYINLFWVIFNGIGIIMACLIAFERPRFRQSERFNVNANGIINEKFDCKVIDISDSGAKIQTFSNEELKLQINSNRLDLKVEGLSINGDVAWVNDNSKTINLGLRFQNMSTSQYLQLTNIMFNNDERANDFSVGKRSGFFLVIMDFLSNTRKRPDSYKRKMIRQEVNMEAVIHPNVYATTKDYHEKGCQIETKGTYDIGQIIRIDINGETKHAEVRWVYNGKKINKYGLKFVNIIN